MTQNHRIGARLCLGLSIVAVLAMPTLVALGQSEKAPAHDPQLLVGTPSAVVVERDEIVLRGAGNRRQVVVTGHYASDQLRDLTHAVGYRSLNPQVAKVSDLGVVTAQSNGSTVIQIQIGDQQAEVRVRVESAERPTPLSFHRDVVPALTKAGCNAGTCHGTPSGKNGFRLSLRGYDPELDFVTLTREVQGRRVNRENPEQSLILQKPTMQVVHEGGRRFEKDSPLYSLLRDWIAEGAQNDPDGSPTLQSLEVLPAGRVQDAPATTQQLVVQAHFSDGSLRDVTPLARFSVNDEEMAAVSFDGLVEKRKRGEVTVSAEYMSHFASARLVFLEPVPAFAWNDPPQSNYVDRHVFAKLKLLRIAPSELCSDEEFIRRASLDCIGVLPRPDEVRSFLADQRADKRSRLIDMLLERSEFADWWGMKWIDRLGGNQRFVGIDGAHKYHQWVKDAMATNLPEDEFVRAILTASGGNYGNPPASFWRRLREGGALGSTIDPPTAAQEVSQLFLGVRIQCARCHNHPGERWTQEDFYGLAAFFDRVRFKDGPYFQGMYNKEETVYAARSDETSDRRRRRSVAVRNPRTGEVMDPKFLGGPHVERGSGDPRVAFADWLTSPDNPFFARMSVNRVWHHLFGRGIIEPIDDVRDSNPPSNAELLDALARDFVAHGYDRKHLIRTIMCSRSYQLSSQTNPTNELDDRYFSHHQIRLLDAEQLLDAICSATGTPQRFAGFPVGLRAVQLPDGEFGRNRPGESYGTGAKVDPSAALVGNFLIAFGRPPRAMACECERDSNTNLEQALQLVGGDVVQYKIESDEGRVARLIENETPDEQLLDELFLATLSRLPTDAERTPLLDRLAAASSRRKTAEDILWALLNHDEFLFQH